VHDWTRVDDGIYHDFHVAWIPQLRSVLNEGLLPEGYYALAEQHFGRPIADVLTLHAGDTRSPTSLPPGGIALAEAPPRVRRKQTIEPALARRRSLAVRHVSGHRLVALLEILSPGKKDRAASVEQFANKALEALDAGVHLLLVDLLPPGHHDPQRMHGVIRQCLDSASEAYDLPPDEPLTLASYVAGPRVEIFLEHIAIGAALPDMPLFLRPDHYVNVPLETTYAAAYRGMPAFWRDILEGHRPPLT
jgi:hypothetical protein